MNFMRVWYVFVWCMYMLILVNGRFSAIGKMSGSFLAVHKKNIRQNKLDNVPISKSKFKLNPTLDNPDINAIIVGNQKAFQIAIQLTFSIVSWYLSRAVSKMDFGNKTTLRLGRLAFGVYILVVQLLWTFLSNIICERNDVTFVNGFDVELKPSSILSEILNGSPQTVHRKKQQITVREYDLAEAKKVLYSSLPIELFGVLFLHLVFRWNTPLLLAPLSLLGSKLQSPVVQVNLWGLPAVGVLKRPFVGMMDSLMNSINTASSPDSDKATDPAALSADEVPRKCEGEEGDATSAVDEDEAEDYAEGDEDGACDEEEEEESNRIL